MEGNAIEQKAQELMNLFSEQAFIHRVDVYGLLTEMGKWYENRIKDYLIKRAESVSEDADFIEKQIIGGIYKDLFEQ